MFVDSHCHLDFPELSADLPAVLALCEVENWPSLVEDPERALRVLAAPGVVAIVAEVDASVIGFAYFQTDREIQAHLSLMVVSRAHRRQGIGRGLINFGGSQVGASRVDLITDEGAAFYRSLPHGEMLGFRVYPS